MSKKMFRFGGMLGFTLAVVMGLLLAFSLAAPALAADGNTIASSTITFQGTLIPKDGGGYTGTIPAITAGFDIYARNGANATFLDERGLVTPTIESISNNDAWPAWDPDIPDGDCYALTFTADNKWLLVYNENTPRNWVDTGAVPMSGTMDWTNMYAAETGFGRDFGVDRGKWGAPEDDPDYYGFAAANGGGAACWDIDWIWGSEVVPLAFPGFSVTVTVESGTYTVTLTPADGRDAGIASPGPVVNDDTGESYETIQAAVDAATAGDTIIVASGTYNYVTEGSPAPAGLIKVTKGVTIKAVDGARPVIDGSGFDGVFKIHPSALTPGSTVIIEGFEIKGNAATGIAITMQGCFDVTPAQVIIRNNWFHGMIGGIDFWGAGAYLPPGWTSAVANVEISNNKFYELGITGVQQGFGVMLEDLANYDTADEEYAALVQNNEFYDIYNGSGTDFGAGVVIPRANDNWEAANAYIAGNIFNNLGIGIAIVDLKSTGDIDVSDTCIYHNSFTNIIAYGVMADDITNAPINASFNWWGTAVGNDIRAKISGKVIYAPWYTSPDMGETASDLPVHNLSKNTDHATIQEAIDFASSGDNISVAADITEGQVIINKNLTITGDPDNKPVLSPSMNTGTANAIGVTGRGWFQITGGATVTISNIIFDGTGYLIHTAIHFHADSNGGLVQNCDIRDIAHNPASYDARGISNYGKHLQIIGCTFTNIYRIGAYTNGPSASTFIYNCVYNGKGEGDWLDYGIEAENGAHITADSNNITGCIGVASVDGSTSAGILVTTYFGPGTTATITNNKITGNTDGIAIGYDGTDTSSVNASNNNLSDNDYGIYSTAPVVNASFNWWGTAVGNDIRAKIYGKVIYAPWYTSPDMGETASDLPVHNLSKETDHATIQEAIDFASTGNTIVVDEGTYTEQLTINKSLTLTGAGEGNTTIKAPAVRTGTVTQFDPKDGVDKTWDYIIAACPASGTINVRIEGFTIDADNQTMQAGTAGLTGVFFRDVKGVQSGLYSCTIQGFEEVEFQSWGVRVYGDSSLTINDNTLTGYTRDGITVVGDDGVGADPAVTISSNDLTGSVLPYNGISIGYGATGTINLNSVRNHTRVDGYAAVGILVYGSNDISVTGNTVENCFYGIMLDEANSCTVSGNILTDVIKRGISLDNANSNTISGNTISGPTIGTFDTAIGLANNCADNTIGGATATAGNTITMATAGTGNLYAIHMQGDVGANANLISYNNITGGTRAVQLDGPPGITGTTTISNNTMSGQAFGGICAYNNGDLVITDNTLTNTVRPLEFWGPVNITVTGNTIDGAVFDGINLGNVSGTKLIENNTICNILNGEANIAAIHGQPNSDNIIINNNNISASYKGILIDTGCTGTVITNNTITGNSWSGITAYDALLTVTGNTINNCWRGIEMGAALTAHHNSLTSNAYGSVIFYTNDAHDVTNNWWGSANGPGAWLNGANLNTYNQHAQTTSIIANSHNNFTFVPWLNSSTDSDADEPGFQPAPDTSFAPVTNSDSGGQFASIQAAINAATAGDTINVAAGLFSERITITIPLTLLGATHGVNKNGYVVPADYGWDLDVESVINNPEPAVTAGEVVLIQNTDDVTFDGFIVQSLNALQSSSNDHLVTILAKNKTMNNINIKNCVIGPNTNVDEQDGTYGRMGLYISVNQYQEYPYGLTNSTVSGNKIFNCEGNGNNIFIWGAYYSYGARHPSPMEGTVIENNEIYGSHRTGIETGGGLSGLTISNNKIYNNGCEHEAHASELKYGHGIVLVRGSSDSGESIGLGPENLTITGNEIYNNQKSGIYMGPVNKNYTITNNKIYNNGWDGIRLDMEAHFKNPTFEDEDRVGFFDKSENVTAHNNRIYNNGQSGIRVIGTPTNGFTFDATENWWGNINGPSGVGPGTGNGVSASVDYSPWLGALPGTSPMTWGTDDSIQDVIDNYASNGDTVYVAAGTYDQNIDITKRITLQGAGSGETGTVLQNTISPNIIGGGLTYSEYKPVITISASGLEGSPIIIRDMLIQVRNDIVTGLTPGILPRPGMQISYLSLVNIHFTGTIQVTGLLTQSVHESGVFLDGSAGLDHLTVNNCLFDNMSYGIAFNAASGQSVIAQYIQITDTIFNNNSSKGFYAEILSDTVFTNVTVTNNGNPALTPDWADGWNAGIDINLKYGDYQNITFNNLTLTGNGIGSANGAGLTVKARGTGSDPSYSADPASLNGVTINGGTVTGNTVGIRFGEPGKDNTGPTNIKVHNATITGNIQLDLSNLISGVTVDATRNWWGTDVSNDIAAKVYGDVNYTPWYTDATKTTTSSTVTVNIKAIPGVTAPVTGGAPVTEITQTDQYFGTVTWSPASAKFMGDTVYTATITLTAKTGYTLEGVTADFFTVDGATTVRNTANSGVVTAVFPVTGPSVLQSISISPASASIAKGSTLQFTATGKYSDGLTKTLATEVTWSSNDEAIATVNENGLAAAISAGSTTIIATVGTVNAGAALTVTAPTLTSIVIEGAATAKAGVPVTLTVRGYYSDGSNDIVSTGIFWTSQTPAIATVSNAGVVNGKLKGNNAVIKATVSGFTAIKTIAITNPDLVSITVLPGNPKITNGDTLQFTAVGNYSDLSSAVLTGVTWTSGTIATATIDEVSGLATSDNPGTTTITATSGAISGNTVLTVTAETLQSITITPAAADVPKGMTKQYTATGKYSDNSEVNITSMVTWTSSDTSVATINAAGLATAIGATGTSNIIATLGDVTSNTAVLTARAAEVVSITITPGNTTVPLGGTGTQFRDFTATATFSDGTTAVIPNANLTWSITNGTGTATNVGNRVTGTTPGTVTVNVQHVTPVTGTTVNASTGLTVTSKVLESIAITDGTATVAAGGTINLTATGYYSDGSSGNITNTVTWSSSNAGVGFMNANGQFKSTALGITNITASLSGKTSPAYVITVTAAEVISITVDPTGAVIPAGTTRNFRAIATMSDGSKRVVTNSAAWSTSAAGIATVSNSGVVTGVAVGSSTIRATFDGKTGEVIVNVTAAVLNSITITPDPGTVIAGKTQQFTATGHYSDTSSANITSMVVWSTDDTTRATVNQAGLVTGQSVGTATVSATLGNKTGTATVTVNPAVLESIVVTPVNPSITLVSGTVITLQFTATGVYSDGTTISLTNTAAWTSSAPGVAANPVNGLATTAAAGTTTISATSGGKTGSTTLTVRADTVAPVVTVTSPKEGLTTGNRNVTVAGKVNDVNATAQLIVNDGAPAALALDANGNFSTGVTLNDGNNTIIVKATDPALNTGKSSTITVKVDPVKPTIKITAPADGLLTNATGITITGTAAGTTSVNVIVNGVSKAVAVTDGAFTTTATLAAGTNVICATGYATGFTGDSSYLGTSGVHTVIVDRTAPVVKINNPVNNSIVSVSSQTITGSIDDPQISTARLILNGGAPVTVTVINGNFSAVVNLTTGLNTISVIAADAVGNSSSSAVLARVTLDTSKPVVTLTSPANNLRTNAASQTISGTVNDPTIQNVTLRINGAFETIAVIPSGDHGVFSTVKTLSEGLNTIEVLATNRAEPPTTGSSGVFNVTVDTTPPTVVINLSDPTDTIKITVTSSEDLQGVPTVDVGGTGVVMSSDGIRQWTGTYNIPGNGKYTVTASVIGIAGNRATATASFARDAMAGESSKIVVSEETTLQVETTGNVTGDISVSTHMESFSGNSQAPEGAGNAAGAFVEINASPDILNNLAGIYVEVSYDPAQLPAGTDESTLRLYLWDVTTGTWQEVPGSGVDTVRHVIYATLTHLSQYGSFGSPVPTPEPSEPSPGGGMGGLPATPGTTNVRGFISPTGRFVEAVIAYTDDRTCSLYIPAGTVGLDADLNPLNEITMLSNAAPALLPEGWQFIGLAYDFGPSGATFDPAITLTWKYNPEDLPAGISLEDLALAYYDEETGKWVVLESTVDVVNNEITAEITHFTTFAVIVMPERAVFTVGSLSVAPAEVVTGETATVTVTVTNAGNKEGDYIVILMVNGVKEAEKSVTVAGSSSQDVSFEIIRETAGTYIIELNGLSGSLKVISKPVIEPTKTVEPEPEIIPEPEATPTQPVVTTPVPTPAPEPAKVTNWAMIWGLVAAAAVLLIGIPTVIWLRRRRD